MGEGGLAPHQKKAWRLNASLVFIDESGLLLAPVVRRSWAPCGQTPILYQRGRARDKVSIIAALTLSPRRRRTRSALALRWQGVARTFGASEVAHALVQKYPAIIALYESVTRHVEIPHSFD